LDILKQAHLITLGNYFNDYIFIFIFINKFTFSPEVWKDQPYDSKSDIWSLGCILYEMITLRPPFRAENMEGLCNRVIKGK
jgi:hypothetical protein